MDNHYKTAIFAGGCFWCTEKAFTDQDGIISAISGYTGGDGENPSYKQVTAGTTGHREAVRVTYDPARIAYPQILDIFWRNIDPFDTGGQFADRGSHYITAIYVANDTERQQAEKSKAALEDRFSQKVATQILPTAPFSPAEDYHQNFHRTNPVRYGLYEEGSGRNRRLREIWGKKHKT